MKKVDYVRMLSEEDKLRVFFIQDRGKIIKFVVQYYAWVGSRWHSVLRVDNCHGAAHYHSRHLRGEEYRVKLAKDANQALTEAETDIVNNYKKIKENFLFSH